MRVSFLVLFAFLGVEYGKACDVNFFECDNGACIPIWYLCDGDDDCKDGSDERVENCSPCDPYNEFTCANGRCIPMSDMCNQDDNCGDMSDESDPATGECPQCPEKGFACSNGRCVESRYVCDGLWNDCGDWSDETEDACPCADDEFRCSAAPGQDFGSCIPSSWVCDEDGHVDCYNGEDEENCTRSGSLEKGSPKVRTTHLKPHWSPKIQKRPKRSTSGKIYKVKKH